MFQKKFINSNKLWGDELRTYFMRRYLFFKHVFFLRDESDIYDYKLAKAMYEFGYDDAVYQIKNIIKRYGDDARLKIILGALRRDLDENICSNNKESSSYYAEKWVFEREHDKRSYEQLDFSGLDLNAASIEEIKNYLGPKRWKELNFIDDY